GPLWSLSYEFWYYMAAMFFTSWLVNKRQFWGWLLIMAVILPLVYIEHIGFFAFFSTWLAGSVWALLYINRQTIEKQFKVLFGPIVVGLTALVIFIVYKNDHLVIANPYTDFLSMITQSLICWLGMLVAMRFILWQEGRSFSFFRADQLAKFSYTLYVIHFPLLILGFSFLHPLLHPLHWGYSAITGVLLGLVIILISSRLAAWIENKAIIWKYIRRLKSLLGTGKA
ncbi:MAG: acyltransferase family protein, partial [Anaerolineales bacterium]|nr:acyltransferase family protein [Anaerolineales bacterium]